MMVRRRLLAAASATVPSRAAHVLAQVTIASSKAIVLMSTIEDSVHYNSVYGKSEIDPLKQQLGKSSC
ncbi:hypothetical protein SLA2020_167120 [Shorea laevis]